MVDKDYSSVLDILAQGADYADVYIESQRSFASTFENNQLDRLDRVNDAGVGLRIIKDEKTYFAYSGTSDINRLNELAKSLVVQSCTGNDKQVVSSFENTNYKVFEQNPSDIDVKKKIQLVSDMNSVMRQKAEVIQATAVFKETEKISRVLNTFGSDVTQEMVYLTTYAMAVAGKDDDIQTGYEPWGGVFGAEAFDKINPEIIAGTAARRAVQNLSAEYAPAGTMPVVIAGLAGGTMVHEAVGHGLEADLACNGMSVYADQVGNIVASSMINVVDDGTLNTMRGSYSVDDEGTLASRNVLIENGELKKYMCDVLYSLKTGQIPTGNGRRQSYKFKPIVRMTNTTIEPGSDNPDDIIKSVDKGLYIVQMGGGQVNTVNGDFVFDVSEGYIIENGLISKPVKNATLIGNGPEVMKIIDMVGDDIGFGIGTCGKEGQGVPVSDGQPTLRIPNITVGGK